MKINKSNIVERGFKLDERKKIEFEMLEVPELPPIEINPIDRLKYNLSIKLKKLGFGAKLISQSINLIIGVRMDNSPVTTKFGNKAFWIKVIGIILVMLGFLGIDFSLEPQTIEQIALFISAGVTLVIGFFFDKKTAENTKDEE